MELERESASALSAAGPNKHVNLMRPQRAADPQEAAHRSCARRRANPRPSGGVAGGYSSRFCKVVL